MPLGGQISKSDIFSVDGGQSRYNRLDPAEVVSCPDHTSPPPESGLAAFSTILGLH